MQDKFIRIKLDSSELDLPAAAEELRAAAGESDLNEINLNEVQYYPLNEQGDDLLAALTPYESIAAANLACTLLTMPGLTVSMREAAESALRLLPQRPMETMDFFCPLALRVEDGDGNLVEGDDLLLRVHEDAISYSVRNAVPPDDNMARHMGRCSRALQDKAASVVWDVGRVGGGVYGIIRCELRESLTAGEQEELAAWITSQNFDGFGETFEQSPIETTDGDIYVSFASDNPGYSIYDQEQFVEYLNAGGQEMAPAEQTMGLAMG